MTCLGCCGVHTSFEPALACYRAAYPKPPSRASGGLLVPADDVENGSDSHENRADSGALPEGGTGSHPRVRNAVQRPVGLPTACAKHRPIWQLVCPDCNPFAQPMAVRS
jgi:hypothetical protein